MGRAFVFIPPLLMCLFFVAGVVCFIYIFKAPSIVDNEVYSKEGKDLADCGKHDFEFSNTLEWQKYRVDFTDSTAINNVTVCWSSKSPVDAKISVPNNYQAPSTLNKPVDDGCLYFCLCNCGTVFIEFRSTGKTETVSAVVESFCRVHTSCPSSKSKLGMVMLFIFLTIMFCCYACCAFCASIFVYAKMGSQYQPHQQTTQIQYMPVNTNIQYQK